MGKIKIKPELIEYSFLALFFSLMLFLGFSNLEENKISHGYPTGYMASDAFQHQTRAEGLKELGNYRYEAFYNMAGYKDVAGFYMPVLYHIGVIFSIVSGLEVYDGVYLLLFILACISSLIMYFIIKKFNKKVAILSLPLGILIFSKGTYMGFTWGHWPSIAAQFFLLAMFWSIAYFAEDKIYALCALFLSASILTHTSEGIFATVFLTIYLGWRLIRKKFEKAELKKALAIGIITFLAIIYYLFIFKAAWYNTQASAYSFKANAVWGSPGFYISYFGILLVFMAIGLIFSLGKLKKENNTALYAGIFMLLAGYTNYIGWDVRAFTLRFFWPIYLSVFMGLGIYVILRFLVRKTDSIIIYYIISILFIIPLTGAVKIPSVPSYEKVEGGIMDGYHWEALGWIEKNTPKNSTIYFLYGDAYEQDALLRNAKRLHYLAKTEDYAANIQNGTVKREFFSEVPADSGGGLIYRTGFFSYQDRLKEFSGSKNIDICQNDYYVLDKVGRIQAFAQYNIIVGQLLLKNNWIEQVFDNGLVVILKNSQPGKDCMPEAVKIG